MGEDVGHDGGCYAVSKWPARRVRPGSSRPLPPHVGGGFHVPLVVRMATVGDAYGMLWPALAVRREVTHVGGVSA